MGEGGTIVRSRHRSAGRSTRIAPLLGSVLVATALAGGCDASTSDARNDDPAAGNAAISSGNAPTDDAVTGRDDAGERGVPHVRRVLGEWQAHAEIFRKYVLIEPGLSDEEVIRIASRLHAVEPDTWYYLMDDDRGFDAMFAALPATRDNDYTAWPYDYVDEHFVARVALEFRGDGEGRSERVWIVEGGPRRDRLVADLP